MSTNQTKSFNTTGPCVPSDHYMLPPLPRVSEIKGLLEKKHYFVLHAPRQSGKTTAIMAAVDQLNEDGAYYALYCTLEALRGVTDRTETMLLLENLITDSLQNSNVEALRRATDCSFLAEVKTLPAFNSFPLKILLREQCKKLDKNLVIFFDEVDTLEDQAMLSFLSQLRDGYVNRSKTPFPRSIALVGMRNIRDYKVRIRSESESLGSSSPFNIIAEALTLTNFTLDEIRTLYSQHTEATGQSFAEEATQSAWYWSEGQPWLVNALARQAVEKILAGDYGKDVTADHIDEAADILMRRRDPHIDSLLARLHEPRVQRIIGPMLATTKYYEADPDIEDETDDLGELYYDNHQVDESYDDALQSCLDLGLVKNGESLRPATPIYASVIVRFIGLDAQSKLPRDIKGKWMDGQNLDMTGLLRSFQQFWARLSAKFL
ncbi:MAG: ATP-binding protein, partial [Deltaproteobacteria bacterium]|nr:ATP-binding protein [Deltaproteobacteria bacterium]